MVWETIEVERDFDRGAGPRNDGLIVKSEELKRSSRHRTNKCCASIPFCRGYLNRYTALVRTGAQVFSLGLGCGALAVNPLWLRDGPC